jgi:UPF0176 protein
MIRWQNTGDEQIYKVVLFYKYLSLASNELDAFIQRITVRCNELGLLGRVLIAHEGFNGTLAGSSDTIDDFCKWMDDDRNWKRERGRERGIKMRILTINNTYITLNK